MMARQVRRGSQRGISVPDLGQVLIEARKRKGLTQEETARAVGVAHRTYQRWETGTNWPYRQHIRELVEVLDIPAGALDEQPVDPTDPEHPIARRFDRLEGILDQIQEAVGEIPRRLDGIERELARRADLVAAAAESERERAAPLDRMAHPERERKED
jgi:transcriptional regulator with XRE-family HTH domain